MATTIEIDARDPVWVEALSDLRNGKQVLLQRNGAPFAQLTALPPEATDVGPRQTAANPPLYYGVFKGKMWIADDFDEPLPEFDDDEDWT